METSHTAMVVAKLNSSIIFCIDGRMSYVFSQVATNKAVKTHILEDLDNLSDPRFINVGFYGDTPLFNEIRETLQFKNIPREDITPKKLADVVQPLVERRIRKEELNYGIVFAGIGEGKTLEVVCIETTAWGESETRLPGQEDFKSKLTVKEMDHYYVTGSGAKWLDEFFMSRFGSATGQVHIPMDMPHADAEKLVVEALTYASHRSVGVGGMLTGFVFKKVDEDDLDFKSKYGDFKFTPFCYEQEDYADCKSPYIART